MPETLERLRALHPEARPMLALLTRSAPRLADLLAGQADPLELLFPQGSTADAEALYGETPFARYYNRLIATAIEAWLADHPGRPLRILEVGGGTGGTTGGLLPHLPAERTRYLFTDLSAGFLNLAEQKFSKTYPFVEYRTFDLERNPLTQGFSPDSCDLILAANVLHATQDLHQTLAHLQPLLVEGGLLLALELTDPPPWVELTFGLTDGWWRFADQRTDQPLLSKTGWLNLLAPPKQSLFSQAAALPSDQTPLGPPRQHLLAAQTATRQANPPSPPSAQPKSAAVLRSGPLRERVSALVQRQFTKLLRLSADELSPAANFMDLGFDSILAVQIQKALSAETGLQLPATLLFKYASVDQLTDYLLAEHDALLAQRLGVDQPSVSEPKIEAAMTVEPTPALPASLQRQPIAVIGLSLRFPGRRAWRRSGGMWRGGSMRWVRSPRRGGSCSRFPEALPEAGYLEGIDRFDAEFFRISPREAELMDPQQRLFLEVAWEALERAGYRPEGLATTGVFVGATSADYALLAAGSASPLDPHRYSGTTLSMVATRTSYLLNLKGPSLTVDTACSSSLMAIHLACQSLYAGEWRWRLPAA